MGMADASALGSDVSSATAATVAPRVISPPGVPDDTTEEQHVDLSRALFGNDNDTAAIDNIPSQHICPILLEPPYEAVHFDLPSTNGITTTLTSQVFERSVLYRFIRTQGDYSLRRTVTHPLSGVRIARDLAWDFFRPVSLALQETLHRERLALGLLLEDDKPLDGGDR